MENAEVAMSRICQVSVTGALQNRPNDAVCFAKSMSIMLQHHKQSGISTKSPASNSTITVNYAR